MGLFQVKVVIICFVYAIQLRGLFLRLSGVKNLSFLILIRRNLTDSLENMTS